MLIQNSSPCFVSFGNITLRPGSSEVVPSSIAERKDFQDAVQYGKVVVLSKDAEPAAEGSKGYESLKGADLLQYVSGLNDLAELKELEDYTSKDKKLQAEVRKTAAAKVEEIEKLKADAGA